MTYILEQVLKVTVTNPTRPFSNRGSLETLCTVPLTLQVNLQLLFIADLKQKKVTEEQQVGIQ